MKHRKTVVRHKPDTLEKFQNKVMSFGKKHAPRHLERLFMDRLDRADLYHYFVEVTVKKLDRIICAIICGLSLGYGLAVVLSKLGL